MVRWWLGAVGGTRRAGRETLLDERWLLRAIRVNVHVYEIPKLNGGLTVKGNVHHEAAYRPGLMSDKRSSGDRRAV
jgi:hypothetical protein